MNKENLRIVFMGTPDFAVESLRVLVENNYSIVGVVTMPDKPSGRGHKIQYSAVKEYAIEQNLPLLQPEKLKDESFIKDLRAWEADLQIVVAFRMLPEIVWNMPSLGTFNLHGSLLPQYRGAAPINWAIMNGEKETGVTTFFLTHEIDTGKIIRQKKIQISETDNVGIIYDQLMKIGGQLVQETVDLIIDGSVESIPQDQFIQHESELKSAPKIFKETCRIDWNNSVQHIYNQIRGLSPYPTAWSELNNGSDENVSVKIIKGSIAHTNKKYQPGTVLTDNKLILEIACKDGAIRIEEIQFPGKKRMKTEELLRGFKFNTEYIFK